MCVILIQSETVGFLEFLVALCTANNMTGLRHFDK